MYILKRNKKNVFLNRPKTKLSRKKVNDITHYLLTYCHWQGIRHSSLVVVYNYYTNAQTLLVKR